MSPNLETVSSQSHQLEVAVEVRRPIHKRNRAKLVLKASLERTIASMPPLKTRSISKRRNSKQ